ncbi:tenascin-N-like isoform X1 [Brachionus plicatilis]|uniref:Tenascin-N-like isoform X1 n=1 Tax=Brachionus plicatilis TaxID=10195 RepID=A0A3M7T767_BRAPC|nr:tenascin-N-like isoform X1 [Brachionus plicatilis]
MHYVIQFLVKMMVVTLYQKTRRYADNTFVLIMILKISALKHVNAEIQRLPTHQNKISCQNNGIFDPASCKCKCLFGFSGNDCSIGPDCGSLPNDPKDCSDVFCYDKDLKSLCPRTCQCKNSSKLCNKISCQNNGIFDPAVCKCICLVGYSGNDCSVSSECGSLPEDPKICLKDFCSDRDLRVLCPKTCKCLF